MVRSRKALSFPVIAGLASTLLLAAPAAMAREPEAAADLAFATASQRAAALAESHYQPAPRALPAPFAALDYDGYRKLRPRLETTLWGEPGNPFGVLPLPRGGLYGDPVEIHLIGRDGAETLVSPETFIDFVDYPAATPEEREALGLSGFRAITRPGVAGDGYEFAVFQGGTYFRAVGEGQFYGVSARALAFRTGSPDGEEFPHFTDFWIIEPEQADDTLTVVALSDSPSAAAAYRFTLRPGSDASIDVTAEIHPRVDISEAGVAPLSSMYLHGSADPRAGGDPRAEVHDSDGLSIVMANGEEVWRPLANPAWPEMSAFAGAPVRFGLEQRERDPTSYSDAEARYERRPSVSIEPRGDWGPGDVRLLEIPTTNEYADNIAAFWCPTFLWRAGEVQRLAYRLRFGGKDLLPGPARVIETRADLAPESTSTHRFVITFEDDTQVPPGALVPDVTASTGDISNIRVATDGGRLLRIAFDLEPADAPVAELRAALRGETSQLTETWLFRWTPE